MNLLNEIRSGFANLTEGGMLSLGTLEVPYNGWVFREEERFGVALELPAAMTISERFAGARLSTSDREFAGEIHHLLRLESSYEALRNEFAVVCAQLIDPGDRGNARKALLADPLAWWANWRQLLGNAVREHNAYSVLGELLAFERLRHQGRNPEWLGPLAGSVDLETPTAGYEVKSTICRYESVIHISGQFQLAPVEGRKVFLVHQRLEPVPYGDSIEMVGERLRRDGVRGESMERLLSQCGLEAGCAARMETFKLLESRLFVVDENFPRITPASFTNGVVPEGILGIEYQVDLSGLSSERF
jgi:hypothetical protein